MTPTYVTKRGVRYRYYISSALVQGQPAEAGSIRRIPAVEVEAVLVKAVRSHRSLPADLDDASLIQAHVARIEVHRDRLIIQLSALSGAPTKRKQRSDRIEVSWQKSPMIRRREILVPPSALPSARRPIRAENRALLVASIARGRRWLAELTTDPGVSIAVIANREGCSMRKVNMTISLAWLAPDLIKAAIDGRLPHGMGVARLCELPAEWSRQYDVLGLPRPTANC
jgi:hypothetical protein